MWDRRGHTVGGVLTRRRVGGRKGIFWLGANCGMPEHSNQGTTRRLWQYILLPTKPLGGGGGLLANHGGMR